MIRDTVRYGLLIACASLARHHSWMLVIPGRRADDKGKRGSADERR